MERKIFFCLIIFFAAFAVTGCRDNITTDEFGDIMPDEFSRITSPSLGEIWELGTQQKINWELPETINYVNIILLKKQYLNRYEIAKNTRNSGSFIWDIPKTIPGSVHYQIKIENSQNESSYIMSDVFNIR